MNDKPAKPDRPNGKPHAVQILVNGHELTMPDRDATVREVRAAGDVPDDETLYLVGQGPDRRLGDLDETLRLHPKMTFESSPDGGVS